MNCLKYALNFWNEHRGYIILYNSDHVINVPVRTEVKGFLPLSEFGMEHLIQSFKLSKKYKTLLTWYFEMVC